MVDKELLYNNSNSSYRTTNRQRTKLYSRIKTIKIFYFQVIDAPIIKSRITGNLKVINIPDYVEIMAADAIVNLQKLLGFELVILK